MLIDGRTPGREEPGRLGGLMGQPGQGKGLEQGCQTIQGEGKPLLPSAMNS